MSNQNREMGRLKIFYQLAEKVILDRLLKNARSPAS